MKFQLDCDRIRPHSDSVCWSKSKHTSADHWSGSAGAGAGAGGGGGTLRAY